MLCIYRTQYHSITTPLRTVTPWYPRCPQRGHLLPCGIAIDFPHKVLISPALALQLAAVLSREENTAHCPAMTAPYDR